MPHPTVPLPGDQTMAAPAFIVAGDQGNAVRTVQKRLQDLGFYPAIVDGDYGPQTVKAVIAFQQTHGICPSGNIDALTLQHLGYAVDNEVSPPPSAHVGDFNITVVTRMFPQTPVQNIQTNLPYVLKALRQFHLDDTSMTLMALATIRTETSQFMPISEGVSKYNTSPHGTPFDLYDFRSDLGNRGKGDGARFKGRGFIQLTGRNNYQVYSQKLGLGNRLLDEPDLANQADIAASILACFLQNKENTIRQALMRNDYKTARQAVNGGTNGLDTFQLAFNTGAQMLGIA